MDSILEWEEGEEVRMIAISLENKVTRNFSSKSRDKTKLLRGAEYFLGS
jgi:hypothetical protein